MKSTTFAFLTAACAFTAQAETATANFKGKVIDASTLNPVAGAKVTFAYNTSISATTDEQGNFTLSGQVTALGAKANDARSSMVLERGSIRLDVASESRVSVEVFSLDSRRVKTLVDRRLGAGAYSLQNPVADLPAGLYTVRARLGRQMAAVKVTSMGLSGVSTFGTAAPVFTRLAKSAAAIDMLNVTKLGYRKISKSITSYEDTLKVPLEMNPGLTVGDLRLYSDKLEMHAVDWGDNGAGNVNVAVWDGGTILKGDFTTSPFEGANCWRVKFVEEQTTSGWGFLTMDGKDPEDMTAWKDGHLNIAIKGSVEDIGLNMESPSTAGNYTILKASAYGYKPDNAWHSLKIPSADFKIDFSEVKAYLSLTVSEDIFDPTKDYFIDDVYWKTTPAPAVVDTTAQ